MMNNKQQLKKQIQHIELQIKQLSLRANDSELYDELQNSLILKKAILKKDLESLSQNCFMSKIKKILPRKKKLICDYFN